MLLELAVNMLLLSELVRYLDGLNHVEALFLQMVPARVPPTPPMYSLRIIAVYNGWQRPGTLHTSSKYKGLNGVRKMPLRSCHMKC